MWLSEPSRSSWSLELLIDLTASSENTGRWIILSIPYRKTQNIRSKASIPSRYLRFTVHQGGRVIASNVPSALSISSFRLGKLPTPDSHCSVLKLWNDPFFFFPKPRRPQNNHSAAITLVELLRGGCPFSLSPLLIFSSRGWYRE